jgi:flagellar motility protein MotE (MotC chaperone)
MNYKVMQRPMFKMGGKAASQGTGITSGLDEKVNMSDGRANYSTGPQTRSEFLKSAFDKLARRDEALAGAEDLINLQALGRVGSVLATEESNNPLEILKNLALSGTEIALPTLLQRQKLDLKRTDPTTDLAFAKALKESSGFGEKVYDKKKRDLAAINKAIAELRAKDKNADISALEEQKLLIFSGFDTEQSIKAGIIDAYYKENETMPSSDYVNKTYQKRLEAFGKGGNAAGGIPNRVNRQMGSPMMGEQPMANPMATERKDVAMETEGQGNDAYAMLRARLPQEIPDDVVRLIAYNKEAFADFASIKNQEDVSSFNQKYGVSMNIDVSTV